MKTVYKDNSFGRLEAPSNEKLGSFPVQVVTPSAPNVEQHVAIGVSIDACLGKDICKT